MTIRSLILRRTLRSVPSLFKRAGTLFCVTGIETLWLSGIEKYGTIRDISCIEEETNGEGCDTHGQFKWYYAG